jgi:hypothetical protein
MRGDWTTCLGELEELVHLSLGGQFAYVNNFFQLSCFRYRPTGRASMPSLLYGTSSERSTSAEARGSSHCSSKDDIKDDQHSLLAGQRLGRADGFQEHLDLDGLEEVTSRPQRGGGPSEVILSG